MKSDSQYSYIGGATYVFLHAKNFVKKGCALITTVEQELKLIKSRLSKLERYYHSNLKYIKYLIAEVDELKKNGSDRKKLY
jgi:septation ring formation regulator EzrA